MTQAQYLSDIPEKHEIKDLQITTALGTALLMYEYKTYFTGEITFHVAQIVNTE
jgi:glutamate 5-kinase